MSWRSFCCGSAFAFILYRMWKQYIEYIRGRVADCIWWRIRNKAGGRQRGFRRVFQDHLWWNRRSWISFRCPDRVFLRDRYHEGGWRNRSHPLRAAISMRFGRRYPIRRKIWIIMIPAVVPRWSRMIKMHVLRLGMKIFLLRVIPPFILASRSDGERNRVSWILLWRNTALMASQWFPSAHQQAAASARVFPIWNPLPETADGWKAAVSLKMYRKLTFRLGSKASNKLSEW